MNECSADERVMGEKMLVVWPWPVHGQIAGPTIYLLMVGGRADYVDMYGLQNSKP